VSGAAAPARPPRIFEAAYYERLAAAEERHGWSRGMRRAMRSLLLPRLPARRPLRVLDAGCGTGLLLGELRQLAGVDPDFYRRYRPADLRRLAEESGFEVLRLTYLDAIPSLAAMVREALAPDAAPAPAAGPPLELVPPTGSRAALGRVSDALHAIEALWLRLSGARLPFGHSLALVARRPQSEAGG
jgi:SAM-dependent methyltransferase